MIHNLQALMAPALMERLTLVVNHVLSGEPAACERLKAHTGKLMRVELAGWPALLPAPPLLAFRITPAGLVEWSADDDAPPTLRVNIDASNPAALALRVVTGETPSLTVDGDAALAGEVDWLLTSVRWDVGADLERWFGPAVGGELHRLGSMLASGLRNAARGAAQATERWRSPRR